MDCLDSYRLRSCQRCSTLGILVHIHPDLGRTGIVQAMHAGSALRAITATPSNTPPRVDCHLYGCYCRRGGCWWKCSALASVCLSNCFLHVFAEESYLGWLDVIIWRDFLGFQSRQSRWNTWEAMVNMFRCCLFWVFPVDQLAAQESSQGFHWFLVITVGWESVFVAPYTNVAREVWVVWCFMQRMLLGFAEYGRNTLVMPVNNSINVNLILSWFTNGEDYVGVSRCRVKFSFNYSSS